MRQLSNQCKRQNLVQEKKASHLQALAEIGMQMMEHCFDYLDAPVERVTGKDVPMPYAENLEKLALPQIDDIITAAMKACYHEGGR